VINFVIRYVALRFFRLPVRPASVSGLATRPAALTCSACMAAALGFGSLLQPTVGAVRVVGVSTTVEPEAPTAVPSSFDDLYAAHFADLTVQLYAYFGDRQEAQDVVQEAFCRALSRWSVVSCYDDPVAWVRRVAWNLAVSRWRRARTAMLHLHRQRPIEPQVDGPSPERVALVAALATLPPQQRRAVVLHYLADLPLAEIAAREGVAEGTVKSWLHRGRTALSARLNLTESTGEGL
jgi:RNA polymerase sigma-70 factor (ECF subfamily)